jgi:diacylglycerol O-acyltransferase / wax synthase
MSKQEALSSVDAAWLGMEDPTNLMMVSGILTFKEQVDYDEFVEVVRHRWLRFDRFRQRVVYPKRPFAGPHWQLDPKFNLNAHIHRVALPAPGDYATLQTMISDLMSTPLDYSKPLWQCHFIEGYEVGTVVFSRLHHAIADGIALMYVLLSMADPTPEASRQHPRANTEANREKRGSRFGLLGSLARQASTAVHAAKEVTELLVQEGLETYHNPSHVVDRAVQGTEAALAAGRLVFRTPDPKTIFKGQLGVSKRAAWSKPLSLPEIKAIKNVTGGTVNDVLVSAMAGSLRRYMVARNAPVDGVSFRAAMPVNIRPPEKMEELGNQFGIVYLTLPVNIADPLDRLHEVRRRMAELKNSPEAVVAFGILKGIGLSPAEAQTHMVDMFGSKATVVMTNVPGPQIPLYIAGKELDGLMAWVPQSGRVSLGLSIISYNQKVFIGINSDVGLLSDPDSIIAGFYEEYELLRNLARQVDALPPDPAKERPAAAPAPERLNLNSASLAELADLPGVGPSLAQRIVAYRTEQGEITAVADLTQIPGIGPKKVQLFANLVTV